MSRPWWQVLWEWLVRRWRPPEPWGHRPASLAALSRYARQGGWTGTRGPARAAGIWWFRLVAVPVTVVCHYTAWLVARPSRALMVAVLYAVAAHTTWAGWLLPWPGWLP